MRNIRISKELFDKMLELIDQRNLRVDNELFIKPDYLNHKIISGNKFRKLKYNLHELKRHKINKLITFGGAYSNHIAAVAAAGEIIGIQTVGIIRGEELQKEIENNPTLKFAQKSGMKLKFISRSDYRLKSTQKFLENLKKEHGEFYLVPEGGTNNLAIKGCEEILTSADKEFDYICCSVGTGGTLSGIINSSWSHQKVLGFPALKGSFLCKDISKFAKQSNWELITEYHFGGYAKINEELISFINQFKADTNIPLDPIYTGKMMYGIFDLRRKGFFPRGSKILAIHTGGLQGIEGMNMRLTKKQMPLIK